LSEISCSRIFVNYRKSVKETKPFRQRSCDEQRQRPFSAWATAHRGKWGQLTRLEKMDKKLKSENMQKEQFSMFMLYFESNQGRQV